MTAAYTRGEYVTADYALLGQEHVRRYRETDGEVGYLWNGVPSLLLTVTGRTSGESRTSPLIFAQHGNDLLVVASQGGAPDHPQWYKNLLVDPNVEVQIKGDRYRAVGRTASEHERPQLWDVVADQWPNYDQYQERTERVIPVVLLTPADRAGE